MKKLLTLIAVTTVATFTVQAQNAFSTLEYVDINKIKASVAVHGDMWWQPDSLVSQCEFPKGSGKTANFISALWMSGYDNMAQLYTSTQTYRTDNDYWPGPIIGTSSMLYKNSEDWARIWKVNYIEIANFKAMATHTLSNTPKDILQWPAKNNPYAKGNGGVSLTITTDMAPFVDVDADGNYNALKGDYPDMKGDQMLWWIFNDYGPSHTNTLSQPMKMQVQAKAYAYSRGSAVDNIIFYEYNITNKSSLNYSAYRCAIWNDCDLGFYADDYVGFDSTRRMAIVYNGKTVDGSGHKFAYGNHPPITGVTLLEVPGDNNGTYVPAGSFTYFNNDNTIIGNPTNGQEYSNYMRSMMRNGAHFKNDYTGPSVASKGYGSGPDVNYVYTGDPSVSSQWSECAANNPPGDRRYVLSTGDHNFTAGSSIKLAFALVITDTSADNACPNTNFTGIKNLADTAWHYYASPLPPKLEVEKYAQTKQLKVYPNPATNIINIEGADLNAGEIKLYDITGRVVPVSVTLKGNKASIDVELLPNGVYNVSFTNGREVLNARFVKE